MSYLVALVFLAIIASLAAALFFMLRGGSQNPADKSKRMARALALRVGFSVLLFLCILLAWMMGWIHPTGIQSGQ
ncbi:twin transmembrane helix small protein [Rhodoferax sp. GW822-FHT02A01]|uniref:twin transmembrane helix small protein n=1 Tax=Rhodoferax sp. GW822-FHT02A01 TaxID=3141537 RepID=UPI00315CEC82